ncbi:MAG TPA: hypothetical protein VE152_14670, partial [Acidimicrobiales bacterium]|nr:hypothetical protein [Acidimicrobiales bacterium]
MTPAPALVLAGLAVLGLGAGVALVAGATRGALRPLPYLAGAVGSACLAAVGVLATLGHLGGHGPTVDLGGLLDLGRTS